VRERVEEFGVIGYGWVGRWYYYFWRLCRTDKIGMGVQHLRLPSIAAGPLEGQIPHKYVIKEPGPYGIVSPDA
jgi:hypothetical protein